MTEPARQGKCDLAVPSAVGREEHEIYAGGGGGVREGCVAPTTAISSLFGHSPSGSSTP